MVSHLFYYQLALLALIWLFVMLPLSCAQAQRDPASRASDAPQAQVQAFYRAQSVRESDAQASLCPV